MPQAACPLRLRNLFLDVQSTKKCLTERIYQLAEDPAGGLADKETDDPLATAKDFGYPGCPAGTNCHEQQQRVQRLQQLEQQQTVFSVQGDQDLQGRTARMQRQRTRLR